ncbi:hypothetical protein HME9302_02396 [Alteripontixanthobacter maritimus]|uniref:DAGKc domain-containing protein n=1 Tax=Alteripontixanthobacter maritimus TaxID=2161824 RepID=A0A369QD62_9SPHN|nr:diacylglycerol kinase family protein [Alteripontixanthobacter maritimus]RDC61177.1 hypothetical protein HME9302_02396 [Alteripontixanthobacter maritimus]
MNQEPRRIWLVVNARAGSNDETAIERLKDACAANGFTIDRQIDFPDDNAPIPAALDDARIDTVAIYTGDGSLSFCLSQLDGWDGQVLVLPGGTMNLLCKRLHGDVDQEEILRRAGTGAMRKVRPSIVRSGHGNAYSTILIGPGTLWAEVREAMRGMEVLETVKLAQEATAETATGSRITVIEPVLGRREGYALMEIAAGEWGLQVDAYDSQTPGDYLQQTWALLRRSFREGPHERLGMVDELVCENVEDEPIEMLIDGEPFSGDARETYTMAQAGVDLLASEHG